MNIVILRNKLFKVRTDDEKYSSTYLDVTTEEHDIWYISHQKLNNNCAGMNWTDKIAIHTRASSRYVIPLGHHHQVCPPAVYTCMALFMYNFRANFSQNDIKDRFISQDKKRNKNKKKKVGDG